MLRWMSTVLGHCSSCDPSQPMVLNPNPKAGLWITVNASNKGETRLEKLPFKAGDLVHDDHSLIRRQMIIPDVVKSLTQKLG